MADTFQVSIVTPDGEVYRRDARAAVFPGAEGSFGVLAHHSPFLSALQPGITTVTTDQGTDYFASGGGVVEVSHEGVVVLADTAVPASSADDAKTRIPKPGHE